MRLVGIQTRVLGQAYAKKAQTRFPLAAASNRSSVRNPLGPLSPGR